MKCKEYEEQVGQWTANVFVACAIYCAQSQKCKFVIKGLKGSRYINNYWAGYLYIPKILFALFASITFTFPMILQDIWRTLILEILVSQHYIDEKVYS